MRSLLESQRQLAKSPAEQFLVRVKVIPAEVKARTRAASRFRRMSESEEVSSLSSSKAELPAVLFELTALSIGGRVDPGRIRKAEAGQFHLSYLNCLEHSVTAAKAPTVTLSERAKSA